jgi:L-aspartate oxidase
MKTGLQSDVLIIGSGIAGLSLALNIVKNSSYTVNILTKNTIDETATRLAQGGFAGVLSDTDSFDSHMSDTIKAGVGLCDKDVVKTIVEQGPKCIAKLGDWGVKFEKNQNNELDLGREGGHLERRVVHVKDSTGQAIEDTLVQIVKNEENITVYEFHTAIDLVPVNGQIAGVYTYDQKNDKVENFSAKLTVIATGGAGKVFRYTSNPDIATGDGVAMAYRAGAIIKNMEFTQFHPTVYYNTEFRTFLVSEALRGEGALLSNIEGQRFMEEVHELKELAPRDIVSRAIDIDLKKLGHVFVYLDISFKDSEFVKNRFPKIYSTLLAHGTDITKEPIPVVPAAHYTIGGISVDVRGVTNLKGLMAIGEAACTGFHGANRLASNSLLEGSVMATRSAEYIIKELDMNSTTPFTFPNWEPGDAVEPDEVIIISHNWSELRRLMWNYVGIVRSTKRLLRAKERLDMLKKEVNEYYWQYHVDRDIIELRNVVDVAMLIVESALARKESRGAHYSIDYPDKGSEARDTLVQKTLGVHFSGIIDQ